MAQEFFINDQNLENKIRELLPSQGGKGAGFDLSASTQIIPIVDLTESAEGSNLRQDLQTASSFDNITGFINSSGTTVHITNTGFWRVQGYSSLLTDPAVSKTVTFQVSDGATTKTLSRIATKLTTNNLNYALPFDFTIFLGAGDSFQTTVTASCEVAGHFRQIADITGSLINP